MEKKLRKSKSEIKEKNENNQKDRELSRYKIELSQTNRGNKQVIFDKKYKFNYQYKKKDDSTLYRCFEYKTKNKCPLLIVLNDDNELIRYQDVHNHIEQKNEVAMSLIK